jgi:hypothetical protein
VIEPRIDCMSVRRQAVVVLVAAIAFFMFTPEVRGVHCSESGCREYAESLWSAPLPPGNFAFVLALAVGVSSGWLTYRLLRQRAGQ